MVTTLSILKKPKMIFFPDKKNGAIDLILGRQTHFILHKKHEVGPISTHHFLFVCKG